MVAGQNRESQESTGKCRARSCAFTTEAAKVKEKNQRQPYRARRNLRPGNMTKKPSGSEEYCAHHGRQTASGE